MRRTPLLLLPLALAACRPTPAADPAALDAVARRYVVLGLELGRHDPNYVDAYYGPDSLRSAAEAESLSVSGIRASAESLITVLGDSVPAYQDSVVAMRHRLHARRSPCQRNAPANARSWAATQPPPTRCRARPLPWRSTRMQFPCQAHVRPNPSVEARPNGVAPGPRGRGADHRPRGPGATPSVPPHLKR